MQGSTTCPRAAPPHTAPVDVGGLWKNIQNSERRLGSDESGVGAPASLPGGSGLVPTTTLSLSESLPLHVLLLVTTCLLLSCIHAATYRVATYLIFVMFCDKTA